jgi:hypothetical protein
LSNRLKIKQNKLIEKVVTSSEVVIFFLFTTNFIDLSNNNNVRAGLNGPIRAGLKRPFTAELKGPISAGLKGPTLNHRGK